MKRLLTLRNLLWIVFIVVLYFIIDYLIAIRVITPYYRTVLYWIGIYIVLAASLNIIIGITGQLSLGHAGFMSIGAYAAAIALRSTPDYSGLIIGTIIGVAISMAISFIVAVPTLRLKGDYLAIATLGVGEIIRILILNLDITNGASGISNIRNLANFEMIYIAAILGLILSSNFKNSAIGRACISIKEDEIASEAMGINTTKYKVMAFVFGAILASVAGSIFATTYYVVKPETFGVTTSINILIIVVFGGMGSLTGTVIAAIFIGIVNLVLQPLAELRMIIYAVVLILVMIYRPQGLMGSKEISFRLLSSLKSKFSGKGKRA